ncbi:hypothetical protein ABIA39_006021 [Nocardia sp. GAS34]|uniref:hypothetical protein n=1 Tax=unclassified Nocardia TaxID=2637762 RepID=UPI003D25ACE0
MNRIFTRAFAVAATASWLCVPAMAAANAQPTVRPVDAWSDYNSADSAWHAQSQAAAGQGAATGAGIGCLVGGGVGGAAGVGVGLGVASIPLGIGGAVVGCGVGAATGAAIGAIAAGSNPALLAQEQHLKDQCYQVKPALECSNEWNPPSYDDN